MPLYVVGVGSGVGAVVVLFLGVLCSCAVVFIYKKRRVKGTVDLHNVTYMPVNVILHVIVSAIRSRILEFNSTTRSERCDTKSEKGDIMVL